MIVSRVFKSSQRKGKNISIVLSIPKGGDGCGELTFAADKKYSAVRMETACGCAGERPRTAGAQSFPLFRKKEHLRRASALSEIFTLSDGSNPVARNIAADHFTIRWYDRSNKSALKEAISS